MSDEKDLSLEVFLDEVAEYLDIPPLDWSAKALLKGLNSRPRSTARLYKDDMAM